MSDRMGPLDHAAVDALGAALALGALEPDELQAVTEHLESCPQPHAELRSLLGAGDVLAASLEPVPPSTGLRDRLMRTVSTTAQEHITAATAARPTAAPAIERRRGRLLDWFSPNLARGLAVAAVMVAIAFGIWNVSLLGQLSARDRALQAVAQGLQGGKTAFRVNPNGFNAPSGYLVADSSGQASLIVGGLAPLEGNRLYELWLIGPDNKPVAVGTFVPSSEEVAVVPLERPISGFTAFAVTAETHRVSSPTLPIVMSAKLTS